MCGCVIKSDKLEEVCACYHNLMMFLSVPAPLYFNGDDTPDLLIRVNKGAWMLYDYSYIAVIDGRDGRELWTFNSSQAVMASSLTVASSVRGSDGMLFIAHGGVHQKSRRETYWSCVRDQADGTAHACADAAREQRHSFTNEDETTSSGHGDMKPGGFVS